MNLVKMFAMMSGLSGTYRFSNAKLSNPESVLEHTGGVVLTCCLLCLEMENRDFNVLAKAALHDVEELLMGDIPRTTKYASEESRKMVRSLETKAMETIVEDLEVKNGRDILYLHQIAKKDVSGLIVEIADVLAVAYKLWEEVSERGNRSMLARATSCSAQIGRCIEKVQFEYPMYGKVLLDVLYQAKDLIRRVYDENQTQAIEEDYGKRAVSR